MDMEEFMASLGCRDVRIHVRGPKPPRAMAITEL